VTPPDVSVIVTVDEEPGSLVELYEEFSRPLAKAGRSFEFVFASYAWWRSAREDVARLAAAGAPVRLLEVGQGVGETALLRLAVEACTGRVLVTLPTYRQVDAAVLPQLVERVDAGADLAVARRHPRVDSIVNRIQGRVLHGIIGSFATDQIHDVGCGLRAIRPEVLRELPLYGDFARFLPLLALREGWRVEELPAAVHPRAMKGRVYGPGVYLRRLIDVVGLLFLLRFTEKPLRFFGLVGAMLAVPGSVILAVVFVQRLGGQGLAERPLLLLGVLLTTLGVQAIALGLIGEMIVHLHASRRRGYRLRDEMPPGGRGVQRSVDPGAGRGGE
jgi:hypothetical protein